MKKTKQDLAYEITRLTQENAELKANRDVNLIQKIHDLNTKVNSLEYEKKSAIQYKDKAVTELTMANAKLEQTEKLFAQAIGKAKATPEGAHYGFTGMYR